LMKRDGAMKIIAAGRNPILRSPGVADGRSSGSAFGEYAWAVASSDDKKLDFGGQADRCFAKIDRVLSELGSRKGLILSATVYLANMTDKGRFDELWRDWVGPHPGDWPQRACICVTLSPATLVEIAVIAAREI
jgi:enamine deaminase RidA (YjgF/YER057c/UK114 family)